MDNNELELQGRIEALARQRNIALDEAVFHAGRYKALQAEVASLTAALETTKNQVLDLTQKLQDGKDKTLQDDTKNA